MRNLLLIIALCFSVAYSLAQTEPHVPIDLDNDGRINITRLEHLKWLSESPYADLTRDYELDNDIDASDSRNWNGGKGFIPIIRRHLPNHSTWKLLIISKKTDRSKLFDGIKLLYLCFVALYHCRVNIKSANT